MGALVLTILGASTGCDASQPGTNEGQSESDGAPVSATPEPAAPSKAQVPDNVAQVREQRVAALKRALEPRLTRSEQGLSVKTLPNGRKVVPLEGRFGHATVLRVNPDGSRERGCFDEAEAAVEFMTRNDAARAEVQR